MQVMEALGPISKDEATGMERVEAPGERWPIDAVAWLQELVGRIPAETGHPTWKGRCFQISKLSIREGMM